MPQSSINNPSPPVNLRTGQYNTPAVVSGVGSIFDLPSPWRDYLVPASFRGAVFHCEQHALESGLRMIEHEFPKRDLPFAENMGHRATNWSVRGYCITYPMDVSINNLYRRDYRLARDELVRQLDSGTPGLLQVQTLPSMMVWCERYRLTEEEKLGGYCVFDMTFIEAGTEPFALDSTRTALINMSTDLRQQILASLSGGQGTGLVGGGTGGGVQA
jgi:prophage DNA circulation protein